ncbi:MAG: GGDEF domain-containing protein [Bacillaceae bacterium]|nr:GGDEF domain-containing protein [Bacillaceae bacterium]
MLNITNWFKRKTTRYGLKQTPVTYFSGNRRLKKAIEQGRQVFLIYIDVVQLQEIENRLGETFISELFHDVLKSIEENAIRHLRGMDILLIQHIWGDDYIVCFTPDDRPVSPSDLEDTVFLFQTGLEHSCHERLKHKLDAPIQFHVGYAPLEGGGRNPEKQMYVAIKRAVKWAKESHSPEISKHAHQFQDILDRRDVRIHYQPIVSLTGGDIYGWESLTRGPERSFFSSPNHLFPFAEQVGKLYQLERICREQAIIQAYNKIPAGKKLFINLNPKVIQDPEFVRGQTASFLKERHLAPGDVVFEITEHHAITDYDQFKKVIEYYRAQGFLIAIDDTGAGHSNLQHVVELSPDFIKLDHSLITNIDTSRIKQAVIESFVTLSKKMNCLLIAEGIERYQELQTLMRLGVDLGQGFYISRPRPDFDHPPAQVIRQIKDKLEINRSTLESTVVTVGDIIQPEVLVKASTKCRDVLQLFQENVKLTSVIVEHEGKPLGLVMRQHFLQSLSTQYGVPLYYDRPVAEVMDKTPLIVQYDESIDSVQKAAMNRSDLRLYDDVIVVGHQNQVIGIVTIRNLIEHISKSRIEEARFSNPLTGLPGNVRIENELKKCLDNDEEFAVIYCDLDRFKQFNDTYGFEMGDRMILFTARFLKMILQKKGGKDDFLGHIGGDDFVIITSPRQVERFKKLIARYFSIIMAVLNHNAGVSVSISLASILCSRQWFENHLQISEHLAKVKQREKRQKRHD